MEDALPRVSVVVATRHRPQLLRRLLAALAQQRHEAFEVIVVDDGPSEDSGRAVAAARAHWPRGCALRLLATARGHGPAAARNTGWRTARAPIVAFTDDDTLPRPDWLAEGCALLEGEPALVAASGRIVVPLPPQRPPTDHERMTQGLERARFATANAFVRRDALIRIGGFDTRFTRAWREDSDLQFRLERLGTVGRCERAVVVHPVRAEPWGVSLRQQRNVFFDALLYRKHPQRYRREVRRVPPWDYYATVLGGVLAVAAAAAGAFAVAAGALAAALMLVLRLAARRLRHASRAPRHVAEMLVTSAAIPFLSVWWRLRGAWHFRTWFV